MRGERISEKRATSACCQHQHAAMLARLGGCAWQGRATVVHCHSNTAETPARVPLLAAGYFLLLPTTELPGRSSAALKGLTIVIRHTTYPVLKGASFIASRMIASRAPGPFQERNGYNGR
jgi:hypothetical protein